MKDKVPSTVEVIDRYLAVFQQHDPSALPELVAADCAIENTVPAPDGTRLVGRAACVGLWTQIATTPGTRFDVEKVDILGERAIIRWRFHWGSGAADSVRGVNLMHVQQGLIVEGLGYVKGPG